MSNEMVERVARAIDDSLTGEVEMVVAGYFALRAAARAAIEAMREPTDAMVKGSDWVRPMYDDPIPSPTEYYQAMIDEILK